MERLLHNNSYEWIEMFRKDLYEIYYLINTSFSAEEFCRSLSEYIDLKKDNNEIKSLDAYFTIKKMLYHEGEELNECSEDITININTFHNLWKGIKLMPYINMPDFYIELYFLFRELLIGKDIYKPDEQLLRERWDSGTSKNVIQSVEFNKRRIIANLVSDIDLKNNRYSRYVFEETDKYEDKLIKIEKWWSDYRFHLCMAITDPETLCRYLGFTVSKRTKRILMNAKEKGIPFFITILLLLF